MPIMAAPTNGSPYPSTLQAPLHKVPSLAPSQELAYRTKCIELRRRLAEIEKNNDETKKRIQRERKVQDKMRLNRAILLHHIKGMMDNGRRLSPEQLRALSDGNKVNMAEALDHDAGARDTGAQAIFDGHNSDGTEEEEIARPQERPLRSKRANHRGDVSMNVTSTPDSTRRIQSTPQADVQSTPHQPSQLPALAPATSPVPGSLQSAFRVKKTGSPPPNGAAHDSNAPSPPSQSEFNQPVRPSAPLERFQQAQAPQLAQQGVHESEIAGKIRQLWQDLPESEKKDAEHEYNEEMIRYEREMDDFKRARKSGHSMGGNTSGGSVKAE